MSKRDRTMMVLSSLIVGSCAWVGVARAGDHEHAKSTTATPHTMRQAGYPQCVSRVSMESYNEHYSGGFIGGGKAFGGHERCSNEGTWGWDYTPYRPMSSRLFLNWSHGRHRQGGTGSYATDGPKPIEHVKESVHEHFGPSE